MFKLKIFALLAISVFSSITKAENGCPDGMMPGGLAGYGNPSGCMPITEQQPIIARGYWATRWGAIAISSKSMTGGPSVVGATAGKVSKTKAQKTAIAECKAKGGAKCVVKLAYYNQCAVLVWGDHGYNLVNDQTLDKATKTAMQSCSNADTNCQIYYADCSLPERVQ